MNLKDWQLALRHQAAERERFTVAEPLEESEYFTVKNLKTGNIHNVFYKGARSKWNYCSCRDFQTSCLGTCKHIEAITLANGGAFARKRYAMPDYSTVYVDYRGEEREVRLRIGLYKKAEFQEIARCYFANDGTLLPNRYDNIEEFIAAAKAIDPRFRIYDDALEFIIDRREELARSAMIDAMPDDEFQQLLDTHLYDYQVEGVKFAFRSGCSLNADEMGLGKTIQAIATAELLRKKGLVESVVVLCPTSLKYQWKYEIERFTKSSVLVVEGNPLQRREQYADRDAFYKICSYHSTSNDLKYGVDIEADMFIFDELQRLKNWDTVISRQIRKLHARYVVALSGTPLENKLAELYSVMNFVDPFCLGPYYEFVNETSIVDETGRVVGYKNLDKIGQRLKSRMLRRRKAEVALQLPQRTDTNLFVPMTSEQAAVHYEYQTIVARLIHKWRRFRFLNESDRRRLLLALSTMRMVCDSTFVLDQKTRFQTKIDETIHIVRNVVDAGDGKIVIFSQWERMLRLLAEALTAEGVSFAFLHGGVPSRKRKALIDEFRSNPDCRVFLSTDAGSTGLNLQSASLAINLDLPWNPAVLEQRIARIYRLGQTENVQIINMIAAGTIEERMLATLNFKTGLFSGVLDDGESSVFLDQNRFDKIIEIVESEINPDENPEAQWFDSSTEETTPEPEKIAEKVDDDSVAAAEAETADQRQESEPLPAESGQREKAPVAEPEINGEELVVQGMTFLTKLADALKDSEKTEALVDSIVTTDKKTGKSTMTVPVPDKKLLTTLLKALGTLLNK